MSGLSTVRTEVVMLKRTARKPRASAPIMSWIRFSAKIACRKAKQILSKEHRKFTEPSVAATPLETTKVLPFPRPILVCITIVNTCAKPWKLGLNLLTSMFRNKRRFGDKALRNHTKLPRALAGLLWLFLKEQR